MDPFETFARQVIAMAEAIRRGQTDALEYRLTDSYRQLQQLAASLDRQLNVDEILNSVLLSKVTRVQELLRILSSLRDTNTQTLASMLVYRRPVTVSRIDYVRLGGSLDRLIQLAVAHLRPRTDYFTPTITSVHTGKLVLHSEDVLSLEEVERFGDSLSRQRPIPIHEVVAAARDIDEFFRRFLMILILISRGIVIYDPHTRTILRP